MKFPCRNLTTFGISSPFGLLSPSLRQVVYALLTRLPLGSSKASFQFTSYDLHVLSTPPAFVLSQDQTLHEIWKADIGSLIFGSVSFSAPPRTIQ